MMYPLINDSAELDRLDLQTSSHFDFSIVPLIKNANQVLEIGCGSGANAAIFKQINPSIKYTGVDIDRDAVKSALNKHSGSGIQFQLMSGYELSFADNSFDLIVIKLVLWGAGNNWPKILSEAKRVMRPGGRLYSFEPEDGLLLFHPPRQMRDSYLAAWQADMVSKGLNPFVGREIPDAFHGAGLRIIDLRLFSSIASPLYGESFQQKVENLSGIFLRNPDLRMRYSEAELSLIRNQFLDRSPSNLVTESYVVTTGAKQ